MALRKEIGPALSAVLHALIKSNVTNAKIYKLTGLSRDILLRWKWEQGLVEKPAGVAGMAEEEHRRRLGLWHAGRTDTQIAREVGCSCRSVWVWRNRHGLAQRAPDGGLNDRSTVGFKAWQHDPFWKMVFQWVPKFYSPETVEDVVGEIALLIADGRLDPETLTKKDVRQITWRVGNSLEPHVGDRMRSLDAKLPTEEGDGGTLLDIIPDNSEGEIRLVELKIIAERMGLDVEAILSAEEAPLEPRRYRGRIITGTTSSTNAREPKEARRLRMKAKWLRRRIDAGKFNGHTHEKEAELGEVMRQIRALPMGAWRLRDGESVWISHEELERQQPEYPTILETETGRYNGRKIPRPEHLK